jgi:hypothetical protein
MTRVVRHLGGTGTERAPHERPGALLAPPWRRLEIVLPALVAGASWLPFVSRPPSPDEGGFLLVASQWSPGTSLYGDYWVDRPPLLITFFEVAHRLGGTAALRVLGIGLVVVSVLLAGLLADRVAAAGARERSRWPAPLAAVVAAVFLSTPLFGSAEVNGELLAVPLVLGGVVAYLRSVEAGAAGAPGPARTWAVTAGALGAAAALAKQNVVDVVVFAGVVSLLPAVGRGRGSRSARERLTAFALGASGATVLAVALAATRGTRPTALWDALVVFRFDAAEVIRSSANDATTERLHALVVALLISGAPAVAAVCAWRLRVPLDGGSVPDLRWPAVALTAWESVAVMAGGSYWLHYLTGLVPGLVLLVVASGQRARSRSSGAVLAAVAYAALSTAVAVAWFGTQVSAPHVDASVASYLRSHADPGDTVVVGFGHPDIVEASGMSSPYPELWSLPVRVRDPRLTELREVLDGSARPTWVVVDGTSLATWGVDAAAADAADSVLARHYHLVTRIHDYGVYRDDRAP